MWNMNSFDFDPFNYEKVKKNFVDNSKKIITFWKDWFEDCKEMQQKATDTLKDFIK